MRQYLAENQQPIQYICIMVDDKGNPNTQISLDALKAVANGANPFDIPESGRTTEQDKQLEALADAGFSVGIKLQMGLPPGVSPKDLDIVTLGSSASNVKFKMFCSQVTAVQLTTPRRKVVWSVYNQPFGQPWSIQTNVNLVVADLDKNLSQSNYLKSHPEVREKLRSALNNLSGTAFSLQQLLFDLDSAVLETVPTFNGVPKGSDAEYILQRFFKDLYSTTAKEYGLPLVSVNAVAQPTDGSILHMTAMERVVSPLKDKSGNRITYPTSAQEEVTTLNYLCAVDNNPVPRISSFDWNWVTPEQINDMSGVIAINRNVLVKYLVDKIIPVAKSSCYTPSISASDGLHMYSNQASPQITTNPEGSNVLSIQYEAKDASILGYEKSPFQTYTRIETKYDCNVTFGSKTINVVQSLSIFTWNRIRDHQDIGWKDPQSEGYRYNVKLIDKTLNDVYDVSIDQNGGLRLTKVKDELTDNSDYTSLDLSNEDWYTMKVRLIGLRDSLEDLVSGHLHDLELSKLQNFVFPGARVFTYKNPFFSEHQDLISEITYLDTTEVSPIQHPQQLESMVHRTAAATPSSSYNGSLLKLTASTELMQNYVQGEIVSPQGKFEALQTSDGHALLFAIGSSGIFYVVEEQSGTLRTGWKFHDLSTTAIEAHFPGQSSNAVVHTFDVSQSIVNGTIGIMMTVKLDGNEHLFISLGNSSSDTTWVTKPAWTIVPFDPINDQSRKIEISNTLFGESEDNKEYLILDILRPSGNSANPQISRYHIDPTRVAGHYWVKHDVSIDIGAGSYQSCLGRVKNGFVDGIYTVGTTGGQPQFIYDPIINAWGNGPPAPRRLSLPGLVVPTAIATARNTDGSTDLYAIGNSTLYLFPAEKQTEHDTPTQVLSHEILTGTDSLRAMSHDGVTTLWGTRNNQVYYLACPTSQVSQPECWGAPIPILSGVRHISPFINRSDGGNTIFAATNGKFMKITQGSVKSGRIWDSQDITIATHLKQKPLSFQSYTTSIHVTKEGQELPEPKAMVNISTVSRKPVYINGLYYVLSPTPTKVSANAAGLVTVVERADGINGSILTISLEDNTTITVNPMDHVFSRITALNSLEKLRNAQIPSQITAGGVDESTEYKPLIPASITDSDLNNVAEYLGLLKDNYPTIQNSKKIAALLTFIKHNNGVVPSRMLRKGDIAVMRLNIFDDIWDGVKDVVGDIQDATTAEFGDVDQMLGNAVDAIGKEIGGLADDVKDAVKHVTQIIRDAATNTLHFITMIGNQVYHAVLDTIDAVVSATKWVFEKIETGLDEIRKFIQTLLDWGEIRNTKNILHNLIRLWMQNQVDMLPRIKDSFDQVVKEVEETMNSAAGITDWSPLGIEMGKPAAGSAGNPLKDQTSSSKQLSNHFQNHASELEVLEDISGMDGLEELINDLLTAIQNEGAVLGAVFDQLKKLSFEFSKLSVGEVLIRLVVILVNGTLSSVQVVVDVLLDLLCRMAQSVVTLLDTKIHIPIISDILNAIGVPDISFLDLFCWIVAAAYTIPYRIANGRAPFSTKDGSVSAMSSARTWNEVAQMFGQQNLTAFNNSAVAKPSRFASESSSMSEYAQTEIFALSHVGAGLLGLMFSCITGSEADFPTGENPLSLPGAVLAAISGVIKAVGNHLVPKEPIHNQIFDWADNIVQVLVIANKLVFSKIGQGIFKSEKINTKIKISGMTPADPRGVKALVDSILVIPGLIITQWHFYELIRKPESAARSAAIVGEVYNLSDYVMRLSYGVAVNDEDPDTRQIAIGVHVVGSFVCSGLQIAEGCIQ
ncbi:gamma-glutamyltranspeptidase periplasmic precursor protein [Rutstroemia sp. NJR-2017a BVV2]|nr:gamma-glutamyltranspeptidase periplasmic precursor protein [Rutstroemia sp. NJR-2017a BVV2]